MRVPPEVLTDSVIDEILTRSCFVGEPIIGLSSSDTREMTPSLDDGSEADLPPSSDATPSESDFSYADPDSITSSGQASSEFSVISHPRAPTDPNSRAGGLQGLANLYTRHSTATDLKLRVAPLAGGSGLGYATLIIPGWIRERTAEMLFEPGDVDEKSIAEVILDALLKVGVHTPHVYFPYPRIRFRWTCEKQWHHPSLSWGVVLCYRASFLDYIRSYCAQCNHLPLFLDIQSALTDHHLLITTDMLAYAP